MGEVVSNELIVKGGKSTAQIIGCNIQFKLFKGRKLFQHIQTDTFREWLGYAWDG
jgi:hypothetical protein